jgi:hypothetical protein
MRTPFAVIHSADKITEMLTRKEPSLVICLELLFRSDQFSQSISADSRRCRALILIPVATATGGCYVHPQRYLRPAAFVWRHRPRFVAFFSRTAACAFNGCRCGVSAAGQYLVIQSVVRHASNDLAQFDLQVVASQQ